MMKPEQFPTVRQTLSTPDRFDNAVAVLFAGVAADAIENATYENVKSTLSRIVYQAWGDSVLAKHFRGKRDELPEDVWNLYWDVNVSSMRDVLSANKKLTKSKLNTPEVEAMRSFVREVLPLAEAVTSLKDKAVKKLRKTVEAAADKAGPSSQLSGKVMASSASIGVCQALLTSHTERGFGEIKEASKQYYRRVLDGYLAENPIDHPMKATPSKFLLQTRRVIDSTLLKMLDKVIVPVNKNGVKIVSVFDADAVIDEMAERDARDVQESFIFKNIRKLAGILEGKGLDNLVKSEALTAMTGREMSAWSGRFYFEFRDGSSFEVNNSVVHSTSVKGKAFARYPLTFHKVKMEGGVPMKNPSEEGMLTEFSGKYYGYIQCQPENLPVLANLGIKHVATATPDRYLVEVPFLRHEALANYKADFQLDLKLRSYLSPAEMSKEDLLAEQYWHAWNAAQQQPLEQPLTTLSEVNEALVQLEKKASVVSLKSVLNRTIEPG